MTMLKNTLAILLGLTGSANAFWRMECPGRLNVARIDPIVNPNDVSAHAHSLHGSSGLSTTSNTQSLKDADCTSCRVTQDKSAYWVPSLYFKYDNGSNQLVDQVGGMLAYYLLYGDNIKAFPNDFRMIAGSNTRRSYTVGNPDQPDPDKSLWRGLGQVKQSDLEQRALGFNCLDYSKTPEGTLYRHYMPDKAYIDQNCKDGIRVEIMFPSCWDGQNTDTDDHMSHMAYPDLVMDGSCPSSHPHRVPSLMYETIWRTAQFREEKGSFVFSNGDSEGYAYHADFMMGWDHDFLQQAVRTCTNPSGRIQDCPLFDVVPESTARQCKLQNPLPEKLASEVENVNALFAQLPGDIGVFGDNNNPDAPEVASSSTASHPILSYTPGENPENPASPLPGQIFKEAETASSPTPTAELGLGAAAMDASSTESSMTHWSTEFVTHDNTVSKIFWDTTDVTVTSTAESTVTEAPAANRRRAHLHGHAAHKF